MPVHAILAVSNLGVLVCFSVPWKEVAAREAKNKNNLVANPIFHVCFWADMLLSYLQLGEPEKESHVSPSAWIRVCHLESREPPPQEKKKNSLVSPENQPTGHPNLTQTSHPSQPHPQLESKRFKLQAGSPGHLTRLR